MITQFATDKIMESPENPGTRASLHTLLAHRRSPRAFSAQPVESWKIISFLEAARWSPSSANEQPWHFIIAAKDDTRTREALIESLSDNNRRWAQNAPLLILGVSQTTYAKNGKPYRHSWYDLGQSVAHLTFQAAALDLAVHQMGGFDTAKAVGLLSIPEGYEPVVIFAVGYAESPDMLPEDLRRREELPRTRKPLENFVFTDKWGTSSRHVQLAGSTISQPTINN